MEKENRAGLVKNLMGLAVRKRVAPLQLIQTKTVHDQQIKQKAKELMVESSVTQAVCEVPRSGHRREILNSKNSCMWQ